MKKNLVMFVLGVLLAGCGDHNHGGHDKHGDSGQKNAGPKLVENLPDKMAAAQGVVTGFTGDMVMIEHGDIQGTSMGAMNMGFGYLNDVDVSALKEGDEIAFLMKVGKDESLRITGFCKPADDGENCLEAVLKP